METKILNARTDEVIMRTCVLLKYILEYKLLILNRNYIALVLHGEIFDGRRARF